jgi:citrate synthase
MLTVIIKIDVNDSRFNLTPKVGRRTNMAIGLDDVVAAETALSDVDGIGGRLVVRGLEIGELAGRTRYEDVVALMLAGICPDLPHGDGLRAALARARTEVFEGLPAAGAAIYELAPYDAVRALVARLEDGDRLADMLRLIAAPAVFLPAVLRAERGLVPLAPNPTLGHAADMLSMMGVPDPARAEALETYLVTVVDHGLNASTFAARIVASTRAGLVSAVLAGMSALKGPLHGGAPGPVLDMLDAIGTPDQAEAWLEGALAGGDRLMGFGHRIYRVRDPRADALKRALAKLAGTDGEGRFALAEAVERAALSILARRKPDRPLQTNVEFYTALLLEAIGFPRDAFTAVFATGRVTGWIAHAREQALDGRLIRPQSRYVGPLPPKAA